MSVTFFKCKNKSYGKGCKKLRLLPEELVLFSPKCYTENNGKNRHLGTLKKTCIPCENSVAEGWTLFQSTHSDLLIVTQERASEHPRGDGLSQRLIPQCQGPTVNRCRVQDSRPPLPRPSPVLSPVPTTFPGEGRGSA